MLFAPVLIGKKALDAAALAADRKKCLRIGPCGLGGEALYLGGRFFDCRYYIRWKEAKRVFKRVAMSKGGFTGKGVFGSMAYLVVQYGKGEEFECAFKREEDADRVLAWIERERPGLPTHSAAAEKKLAAAAAEEEARFLRELTPGAEAAVESLRAAGRYLERRPALSDALTAAAKQKRIADHLKPGYLVFGTAVAALGVIAALYGICGLLKHTPGAGYYLAGGGVAVFTMLAAGILPSRWNSKKYAQQEWDRAVANSRGYIADCADCPDFPVPPQYAHPIVLLRMIRALREGRAQTAQEALAVVKDDLRALNSSVTVTQKEHDEVVAVKPLFLVCDYAD